MEKLFLDHESILNEVANDEGGSDKLSENDLSLSFIHIAQDMLKQQKKLEQLMKKQMKNLKQSKNAKMKKLIIQIQLNQQKK